MSDAAAGGAGRPEGAFRGATMILVLAVGILAFVGLLLMTTYAPDLQSGRNGGTHALSNAATGFSGIVRLADATGRNPSIVRNERQLEGEELVVLTPESGLTDLSEVLELRGAKPTLLVMPKWNAAKDPRRSGWVRINGLKPAADPEALLAPDTKLEVKRQRSRGGQLRTVPAHAPAELRFAAPRALQTVSGKDLRPIVTDARGRMVVAQFGNSLRYVLADPDLLANHGLRDEKQAAAALALLDFLNATDAGSVTFDVTLNGLARSPSPLRLAFDPPFLAATLAIVAAMLLAGWQALYRFGPERQPARALPFGKAALIDNTAALIRKAKREASLGGRYVEMMRERAASVFGVPDRLREGEIDAYLDRLSEGRRFSALAAAAQNADSREDLLAAAQELHQWQRETAR